MLMIEWGVFFICLMWLIICYIQCNCSDDRVEIDMECFVRRYQPDQYEDWLMGEISCHPEDDQQKLYKKKKKIRKKPPRKDEDIDWNARPQIKYTSFSL